MNWWAKILASILLSAFVAASCVCCGGSVSHSESDQAVEDLGVEDPGGDDLGAEDSAPVESCLLDVAGVPDGEPVPADPPHGLLVKLTSQAEFPSGATSFTVQSGSWDGTVAPTVSLGGFVMGDYDTLTIFADFEGADAPVVLEAPDEAASGFSYFNTPPIRLQTPEKLSGKSVARTTTVRVLAERGDLLVEETAVITANPGFLFPLAPGRYPQVIFTKAPTNVVFTLDLNRVENFDSGAIHLLESDATCSLWANGVEMLDDGNVSSAGSGDEISNDRVYSRRVKLDEVDPGLRYYRVAVQIGPEEDRKVAFSPCVPVQVVSPVSVPTCNAVQADLDSAGQIYDKLLCLGTDPVSAREQTARYLRSQAGVAEVGYSKDSELVWVAYDSGLLGAVEPTFYEPGVPDLLFSATGDPPSEVEVLESRLAVSAVSSGDFKELVDNMACPPIRGLGLVGQLASLRGLSRAGITFLGAGGGLAFGGLSEEYKLAQGFKVEALAAPSLPAWAGWEHDGPQDVAWTQSHLACGDLFEGTVSCLYQKNGSCCQGDMTAGCESCPSHLQCVVNSETQEGSLLGVLYDHTQADLLSGRAVLGRGGRIGILPAFVAMNSKLELARHFAFLGYSGSLNQGAMAAQFLAGGANTVVGTLRQVHHETAHISGSALIEALTSEGITPSEALPRVTDKTSKTWVFLGQGNLDLSYSGLLNADFHTGNLKGWEHSGDARVLSYWCGEKPPAGKFMALISTGLGYTVQTGTISQEFCPTQVNQFSFAYDFISHEFLESCGTTSDDKFQAYLEDLETGNRIPVTKVGDQDKITLNHLCPWKAEGCAECPGPPGCECGDLQPAEQPWDLKLWPQECGFSEDGDGKAYQSLWRNILPVNITSLAGLERPVKLVLRVDDEAGTAIDTTVLLGSLLLQ